MEHLERSGEEVRPLTKWIIEQSGNAGRKLTTEELFGVSPQAPGDSPLTCSS